MSNLKNILNKIASSSNPLGLPPDIGCNSASREYCSCLFQNNIITTDEFVECSGCNIWDKFNGKGGLQEDFRKNHWNPAVLTCGSQSPQCHPETERIDAMCDILKRIEEETWTNLTFCERCMYRNIPDRELWKRMCGEKRECNTTQMINCCKEDWSDGEEVLYG